MTTLGAHLRAALAADDVAAVRSLLSELSRSPQDDAAHGVDAALRLAAWARLLVRDAPTGHADGAIGEASVLDADVRRTRQDEAELSAVEAQAALRALLRGFCARHGRPYRQGLNEVAAPFAALGVAAGDERAAAAAFGAFVGRYGAAVYLAPAGTEATAQTVDGFGALALYHDPAVAAALAARGWPAQLAATPWLLTLGAKAAGDLASCCRIFDAVIAADDAAHVFCVGVGLLAARRTELLAGARGGRA